MIQTGNESWWTNIQIDEYIWKMIQQILYMRCLITSKLFIILYLDVTYPWKLMIWIELFDFITYKYINEMCEKVDTVIQISIYPIKCFCYLLSTNDNSLLPSNTTRKWMILYKKLDIGHVWHFQTKDKYLSRLKVHVLSHRISISNMVTNFYIYLIVPLNAWKSEINPH